MKENIPVANIEDGKVYLFQDGEAYTAYINKSVFSGNLYKYSVSYISKKLIGLVYDTKKEVKFSEKHNAMEFNDVEHFNTFLMQEGYEEVLKLMEMVGIKRK